MRPPGAGRKTERTLDLDVLPLESGGGRVAFVGGDLDVAAVDSPLVRLDDREGEG